MVFDLCLGRGRDGPKQFLGSSAGILQSDGYAAYEGVGGPALVHAACWTILFEAGQLNPDDAARLSWPASTTCSPSMARPASKS